jgi:hypothetical protein
MASSFFLTSFYCIFYCQHFLALVCKIEVVTVKYLLLRLKNRLLPGNMLNCILSMLVVPYHIYINGA